MPYLGLQLRAAGFLFNALTDGLLGEQFGMWVLASVVLSYVASGGLRTMVWVAVLQVVLLVIGIVVVGLLTLHYVGGWDRLIAGVIALAQDDPVRLRTVIATIWRFPARCSGCATVRKPSAGPGPEPWC